jgi:uncharacterized membrane protein YebE (DUF533 family)
MNLAFSGKYGPLVGPIVGAILGYWVAHEMPEASLQMKAASVGGAAAFGLLAGCIVWLMDWSKNRSSVQPKVDLATFRYCPVCARQNEAANVVCVGCGGPLAGR